MPRALRVITENLEKEIGYMTDPQTLFISLVERGANQTPWLGIKQAEGGIIDPKSLLASFGDNDVKVHSLVIGNDLDKDAAIGIARKVSDAAGIESWIMTKFDTVTTRTNPKLKDASADELIAVDLMPKADEKGVAILYLHAQGDGELPVDASKVSKVEVKQDTSDKSATGCTCGEPTKEPISPSINTPTGATGNAEPDKKEDISTSVVPPTVQPIEVKVESTSDILKDLKTKATCEVTDIFRMQFESLWNTLSGAINLQGLSKDDRKDMIAKGLGAFNVFMAKFVDAFDDAMFNNVILEPSEKIERKRDKNPMQSAVLKADLVGFQDSMAVSISANIKTEVETLLLPVIEALNGLNTKVEAATLHEKLDSLILSIRSMPEGAFFSRKSIIDAMHPTLEDANQNHNVGMKTKGVAKPRIPKTFLSGE
jgi:hypothetical protein